MRFAWPFLGWIAIDSQQPQACDHIKYKSGQQIILEGEKSLDVFYIEQGHVRINKRVVLDDGREIQSGFSELGPGETFGELNLFDGSPRSASVQAYEDVELIRINRDFLLNYMDQHPDKGYHLLKYWLQKLTDNLRLSNDRSSHLFAWGLKQHGIDKDL